MVEWRVLIVKSWQLRIEKTFQVCIELGFCYHQKRIRHAIFTDEYSLLKQHFASHIVNMCTFYFVEPILKITLGDELVGIIL